MRGDVDLCDTTCSRQDSKSTFPRCEIRDQIGNLPVLHQERDLLYILVYFFPHLNIKIDTYFDEYILHKYLKKVTLTIP